MNNIRKQTIGFFANVAVASAAIYKAESFLPENLINTLCLDNKTQWIAGNAISSAVTLAYFYYASTKEEKTV